MGVTKIVDTRLGQLQITAVSGTLFRVTVPQGTSLVVNRVETYCGFIVEAVEGAYKLQGGEPIFRLYATRRDNFQTVSTAAQQTIFQTAVAAIADAFTRLELVEADHYYLSTAANDEKTKLEALEEQVRQQREVYQQACDKVAESAQRLTQLREAQPAA